MELLLLMKVLSTYEKLAFKVHDASNVSSILKKEE